MLFLFSDKGTVIKSSVQQRGENAGEITRGNPSEDIA